MNIKLALLERRILEIELELKNLYNNETHPPEKQDADNNINNKNTFFIIAFFYITLFKIKHYTFRHKIFALYFFLNFN